MLPSDVVLRSYEQQRARGEAFEDYVTQRLYDRGIVLVPIRSRTGQFNIGENRLGMEIKFDDKLRATGNLYIETAEKRHAGDAGFVPSGILRPDSTWLYAIGDFRELFIFSKRTLRLAQVSDLIRFVETPTSRGMLMPRALADNLVELYINWHADELETAQEFTPA